jgi:hypothetical protein
MAVSRRIRLGGSVGTLSLTEGKFRVKGNCFQASAGDAIFGNGSYQDGSTRRFSGDATPSRENGGFFSLGRMIAITDNTSLQRPALRQNRLHHRFRRWKKGKADIQGTAPHDDPV